MFFLGFKFLTGLFYDLLSLFTLFGFDVKVGSGSELAKCSEQIQFSFGSAPLLLKLQQRFNIFASSWLVFFKISEINTETRFSYLTKIKKAEIMGSLL